MPSMLMCRACFSRCICLSFILLRIFTSAASRSCFFQRPLQATTFILCLLVRPDAVRFQVSRGHALTHKFSLPFRIVTGHKLVVTSYADGSGGPLALRTSPLASELPLTCEALPFAGGASAPYLPGCARQLFIVRCAHYARGASLSTFGFVTIVPRYLLPQVIPSHSFAALTALIVRRVNGLGDQPRPASVSSRAPPEGALARAPGGGTLPLNILGIMRNNSPFNLTQSHLQYNYITL